MDFLERKQQRTAYYYDHVYKQKQQLCLACNGSGYYDDNGSPKCSSCDGTGVEQKRKQKREHTNENNISKHG